MEEGALSIDSFVAELSQAGKTPEQPAKADSGAAEVAAESEQPLDDVADPETAQAEDGEQPEEPVEESGQDEAQAEPVHKWKTANGETIEATESELRAGYLRQQDYTHKTQQVAETVKQAQANFQQQQQLLGALSAEIGQAQALQAQIDAFKGVDWAAADAQDPQAVARAQIRLLNLRQSLADVQAGTAAKAQQLQHVSNSRFEQSVAAAERHLEAKLPELNREEIQQVFTRMQKLGASGVELHHMRTMPWLVEAAVYANRWLELQAKKPEVQNKVRTLPPPTTKPRAAVPSSKTDAVMKAVNARATFSPREFAKLLNASKG